MPRTPPRVCDLLEAGGVHREHLIAEISRGLFAWPSRVFEAVRLALGGSRWTAEHDFVLDFGSCATRSAVEQAVRQYRSNPCRDFVVLRCLLGGVPTTRKALRYFRKVKLRAENAGGPPDSRREKSAPLP